ncbi:hypothetical protein A9P82_06350 [Arachidicoccus ginsenosidimutans]|uniref:DUF6934 family protein n=1 Tax=Arachidicoccus sp. BS20 TaxID=1850526 RepID=UPI0007F14306|nr:hypothetical protein [Arachidicoccus sp. BS20]ANI88949.1 hypothetical protein A9P82_06350 [Arachidicoccus sp. BS20]
MKNEKYYIESNSSLLRFEFFSEGPNGKIKKQVIFRQTDNPKVFNLGFGDVDIETGIISDIVITNNSDSKKVLATVALTVLKFFEKYPDKYVFATGSTPSRTRLYRIGISNNFEEISDFLEVFGYNGQDWEIFKKGKEYDAFLVRKKI